MSTQPSIAGRTMYSIQKQLYKETEIFRLKKKQNQTLKVIKETEKKEQGRDTGGH